MSDLKAKHDGPRTKEYGCAPKLITPDVGNVTKESPGKEDSEDEG